MLGGGLYGRYFLDEGARLAPEWDAADPSAFADAARLWLAAFPTDARPNEAETEERLINPVLGRLGWGRLPQQRPGAARRDDVPDALLFADDDATARALKLPTGPDRYRLATVVVECKRWDEPLDRADSRGRTPANQALRYLRLAEESSRGAVRWALLTNGRLWRLYHHDPASALGPAGAGGSRAERYLEADLPALLAPGGEAALRTFFLLFRRAAFEPRGTDDPATDRRPFVARALDEARDWRQRVTAALSRAVFEDAYPGLLAALAAADPDAAPDDPAWPGRVRDAALILLYRLLFLLYAEDRDLLPVGHAGYDPLSVSRLRDQAAGALDANRPLSATVPTMWPRLAGLFVAVARGDDAMGLPPYNGGLFDPAAAPLLARAALPDAPFARLLDALSRTGGPAGTRERINYRDLSVSQLGAIYEGLLERAVRTEGETVVADRDDAARHEIGAYYTPDSLVRLVLRRAVGPALDGAREGFDAALARVRAQPQRPAAERLADLRRADPAEAILSLRVVDPAMGSGHFLVALVDMLTDAALEAMEAAAEAAAEALPPGAPPYRSPLAERVAAERDGIRAAADAHGWYYSERHLDDRHLVRRLVLKRVPHGVDANPLAVELAKLSLWLHSFTVGAPLSFLDHHLRCGDSLFGAWVAEVDEAASGAGKGGRAKGPGRAKMRDRRGGAFLYPAIASARAAAEGMARVEASADASAAQVAASRAAFGTVEEATAPLRAFLDLWHAGPWLPKPATRAAAEARDLGDAEWLDAVCGDPVALAHGTAEPTGNAGAVARVRALLAERRAIARERRFLHWQPAFPGVWADWTGLSEPTGGFDAVVGNPPYVRQEGLAALKPALRARYAAFDGAADLYVYFYEQGLRLLRPGGRLGYVVTNKWLRAGYAEALRGVLAERAWVESLADFGHAKAFFPGTDVFPSVLVARRPHPRAEPPESVEVAVIPRDAVPYAGLEAGLASAAFPMPRLALGSAPWVLEPPEVLALLDRLRRDGAPLREYAGTAPLYGVKTGLNEAFVVDTPTRDRLVAEHPASADLLRPFLRGQDVGRWAADWDGLWMVTIPSSSDRPGHPWAKLVGHEAEAAFAAAHPPLHRHMKSFEARLRKREDQGRFWWELRPCAYYDKFARPKIMYQVIQYHPRYTLDTDARLSNDKAFFVPSGDPWLLTALNSPLLWWVNWRLLIHMKDEALNTLGYQMEVVPIPRPSDADREAAAPAVARLHATARDRAAAARALADWLRTEHGLAAIPAALREPWPLSADAFAAAIRAALPRRAALTSAAVAAIRAEHAATVAPMAARLAAAARDEAALAARVEAAFALTREERALVWRTAPPRMPLPPPAEEGRAAAD